MIKKLYKEKNIKIIAWHIAFWLAYWLFNGIITYRPVPGENLFHVLTRIGITLPVDILATYTTVYFLMPKFLYRKHILRFWASIIITVPFFVILQSFLWEILTKPLFLNEPTSWPDVIRLNWVVGITNIYLVVAGFATFELYNRAKKQEQRAMEKSLQSAKTELKFLKGQIHPHFLFNTLNNLYALSIKNSEKTPEVVLKLSDLLSFMLYECEDNHINLAKEINMIKDYTELEAIRYNNDLDIGFSISGEPGNYEIAPLLLFPFVENAFKHGVSKIRIKPWVKIKIDINDNILLFNVQNLKPVSGRKNENGLGNENVQKRLSLLYPNSHEIIIKDYDETYSVSLKINLAYENQLYNN